MAGAAVISAIQNAVGRQTLPYVFGGDGALVAIAPGDQEAARAALADVQTWVREELDLGLRAALVPVAAIRAAGHDVTVARYGVGEVAYAMFAGGGAAWADREMKAGRFLVPAAPAGARPDLTGLSCRWSPIHARNGTIVSIIAVPVDDGAARGVQRARHRAARRAGGGGARRPPRPRARPRVPLAARGLRERGTGTRGRRRRAGAPGGRSCSSPPSGRSTTSPARRPAASTRADTGSTPVTTPTSASSTTASSSPSTSPPQAARRSRRCSSRPPPRASAASGCTSRTRR